MIIIFVTRRRVREINLIKKVPKKVLLNSLKRPGSGDPAIRKNARSGST